MFDTYILYYGCGKIFCKPKFLVCDFDNNITTTMIMMEYVNKASDSDLDPGEGECLWEQVSSVQWQIHHHW